MRSLGTLVVGLLVVFLDVGAPDLVADPVGWLLVLYGLTQVRDVLPDYRGLLIVAWACLVISLVAWPANSLAHVDVTSEWIFSLATLGFCFLLCDALSEVTGPALSARFAFLRVTYIALAATPVLIFGLGWDDLAVVTSIGVIAANVALLYFCWESMDHPETIGNAEWRGARPAVQRPSR